LAKFALIVFFVLANLGIAFAQAEKPPLKWGMDSTGGAPYVFDNDKKGFEVELANYLAKELGRDAEPVNLDWDKLPDLLNRNTKVKPDDDTDLDIVLNGYEYDEKKFKNMASIPYYIYRLGLVVNSKNTDIRSWDDLRGRDGKRGKKVGVLETSAAQRYLQKTYGDTIELVIYKDVSSTCDLVANGQLDATVQDNPAASFYVAEFNKNEKRLKQLDELKAQGFYVILTRAEDKDFREQINAALRKGIADGTLEKIYRKYGIWNEDQERLGFWMNKSWGEQELSAEQKETASEPINWPIALRLLVMAALMTVFLAISSMPLATVVGMLVAVLRLYGPKILRPLLSIYVEVLRGTPLLLQLWVLMYLLPQVLPGFGQIPATLVGILGLALNYSASQAEHFRGSFLNLPRGQYEAALSLGLPRWKAIRYILAPQAFRAAVPSVTNDFVALFKDTAVCSVIAVMELTKQYNTLYNNHRDHILSLAAITACLYLMMSYPLALAARRLEHKTSGR
jgi:polar amino acid transport system substrate-binding protein